MERKTRTCCVCGSQYKFCNRCPEDAGKPVWHFIYCTENCRNVYDAMTKYEWEQITADEASARLKKLDLSKMDSFGESYKETYKKIMSSVSVTEKELPTEAKAEEKINEKVEEKSDEKVSEKAENDEDDETFRKQKYKRVRPNIE